MTGIRQGMVAMVATLLMGALFSLPLAMSTAARASAHNGRMGAVNVLVTLPAGHRGGCREAARLIPDLVVGSPVNIRGRDAVNVTSLTWDESGTFCLAQAETRLRPHHRYVVAPWSAPWRAVRTDSYRIAVYRLRLR